MVSGRVKRSSKSRGSGRVESTYLQIWRVGSGRVVFDPTREKPCLFPGLFAGHDPTRYSGQKVFKISRVGSGRVGSGRVKRLSNIAGWVRSGHEFFKSHEWGRVGSGQDFFKSHGSGQVGSRGDEKLTGRVR